jgi:hypothetical protein
MKPSELLEYESHLMAFMQELTFQEGKPLSCITKEEEGSTELVEYSHTAETSPDRQVYVASLRNTEDDEPVPEYDAELLADCRCLTGCPPWDIPKVVSFGLRDTEIRNSKVQGTQTLDRFGPQDA